MEQLTFTVEIRPSTLHMDRHVVYIKHWPVAHPQTDQWAEFDHFDDAKANAPEMLKAAIEAVEKLDNISR